MRLIIQSYLKTFLKHWVSTLGTLLFIIMLACVVMGLMSTPLQLQTRIQWAKSHSVLYDWQVDESDVSYSESFAFDYFLLNGYNYAVPSTERPDHLLSPWSDEAKVIEPGDFPTFLQSIKENTISPAEISQLLLTPSFYLYVDSWASSYLNNKNSIPSELQNWKWWEYFHPEYFHPNDFDQLTPQAKSFLRNFTIDFATLITNQTEMATAIATNPFNYRFDENSSVPIENIAHFFVEDLTSNAELSILDDESNAKDWFTAPQRVHLYNAFLEANELDPIVGVEAWNPPSITNELIDKAKENKKIYGLGVQIFNPKFRQIIVPGYYNNAAAYLVANALTTKANPRANEGAQNRYEVQTHLSFSLSEVIPGNFTPSFSTDVSPVGDENSYNRVLIDSGREPVYQLPTDTQPSIREIMVSPAYLKKNKLGIGSTITLPKADFADDIDLNDTESREVVGTSLSNTNEFRVVGSGFTYENLTPGPSFRNFVQPLRDYTYSYLPNNYIALYQKATFLYYQGSLKNYPVQVVSEVKNLIGNESPYDALIWKEGNDIRYIYSMFSDATELVKPFSKLPTISSLNTIKIQLIIYICLGLVSLILAFIFINFIIKKEINETRRQLGIFKSFGYGIAELSLIFATKTLITITVGIIVGWICSIPLQFFMAENFTNSVMFTYQRLYLSALLLVTLFIFIPLLFTIVSYLLTLSYLREPALLLITNRQKMPLHKPHNGLISKTLEKRNKGFKYRLSSSFVKTSMGKFVVVQLLFGFSALLYSLIFGARTVMYQVINQSFSQIHSKTDHEYAWTNRNRLVIDESTGRRYSLQNIENWEQDKINYINYKGYDSPLAAMNDENNSAINGHLNLSRYSFRTFFDALSNSVVERPEIQTLNDWWLLPESIALERYAEGHNWNPADITSQNYYLYKILLFKGTDYRNNRPLSDVVEEMKKSNKPYQKNILSSDFTESWLELDLSSPNLINDFATTFLGLISQDPELSTNNFFLTDLSRLFSMVLAENYITSQLSEKMQELNGGQARTRYPAKIVQTALQDVYKNVYSGTGKLNKFDPRNSIYWGFTDKNPLFGDKTKPKKLEDNPPGNDLNISNIFKNIKGLSFNLLAAAMITKGRDSMLNEPVVNFNNLFYNSDNEQLQLLLRMTPENKDWGSTSILLSDFNSNSPFGSPDNVYNFAGVSAAQWAQMTTKPGAEDEAYFNGILPYAIAKLYDVKVGDVVNLTTKTTNSVPIKIKVVGINESVTLPLATSWQINVDYNTFAKAMFTSELQAALGIGQTPPLSPYYFNGIISQNPMVDGKIKINGIGESLDSIRFVGNQLSVSLAPDKWLFSSFWQTLIDYLLVKLEESNTIDPVVKEQIRQQVNAIRSAIHDPKAVMVTNPMVLNSSDSDESLVSVPYNLARIGVQDFAGTMNQLMFIFLLLQSVLLTITLIVVMNIVVDEAAVIILTLRSLGYSHNEINWIIMGPYVFWVIVSFIIAYIISMIAWRLLLIYAQNNWNLVIFFRFSITDLVVPFCVLAVIMLIGWLASDYTVNRRPLTQITDAA